MKLYFTKMEGLGNDFILIDDLDGNLAEKTDFSSLSETLCSRRFGIGADGIIIAGQSSRRDFKFTIFNSDGSRAQMCGNGMRCFARYLFENKITPKKKIEIETDAGLVVPEIITDNLGRVESVKVDMGMPVLEPSHIPFVSSGGAALNEPLLFEEGFEIITALNMGNPHAVIFVDDLETVDVAHRGQKVETHDRFPEKANVEFVQVLTDHRIKMKVWERGAGMTLACGTGACASLVAAHLNGKTASRATVELDGGILEIEWDLDSRHVFKKGPAAFVYSGTMEI